MFTFDHTELQGVAATYVAENVTISPYVKLAHSINETARALGISPGLVRLEKARGRLRPTYVARRVLIMPDELDRYLAAGSSRKEKGNG
jgi:hypothetical protein